MVLTMIAVFTLVMIVGLSLLFSKEKREVFISLLLWLISFCTENVCMGVFSKLWKIFERLVHVHLENNCLAHLISST